MSHGGTGVGALLTDLGLPGLATLVLLGLLAVGPRARRHLRRGAWRLIRHVVTGGARRAGLTTRAVGMGVPVRVARQLRPEAWVAMCEARRLVGLRRGRVRRTPLGVDVDVHLGGALTLDTLSARVLDLETGLGVRRGAIRVEPGETADRAVVRVTVRNPLARTVRWTKPGGAVTVTTPVRLSMDQFGEWTEVDPRQRILIVGASGSGKSSVQRVLAATVILAADADLEVWDLKSGAESQHYEGKATARVTTAAGARARLARLIDEEIPRRAMVMRNLGTSTWPTSPAHRDLVVMVDEGAALIRALDATQLGQLFTFIEQARAFGIHVWWATQFPKATNLPTELRSQMNAVIALKMRRASETRVVFEDLAGEGWQPHRLPGRGWLMLLDDEHPEPVGSRAAWLHERAFRALTPVTGAEPETGVRVTREPVRGVVIPPRPTVAPTVGRAVAELGAGGREGDGVTVTEAVTRALRAAPEGLTAAELVVATGRGKSAVYGALSAMREGGVATRVRGGRHVLTGT